MSQDKRVVDRTLLATPTPKPIPAAPVDGSARTIVERAPTPAGTSSSTGGESAADVQAAPGTRINQFELIREIGRGGMGQVFLARDTKLARLVALKFIGNASEELTRRFLIEARATARCQHENIVLIYEADEWQGKPYMALEYLEGSSLDALLQHEPLPVTRAVDIAAQVVRALARAHELSIVHCDLKPENIFVTSEGVVKVLDFGIARALAGDITSSRNEGISGTMPYMAPEQWGADEIDHRTDLWAFGIVLWQMLTLTHPLQPLSQQRLMHAAAMLDEPMPAIASVMPDCPSALEKVIARCLAKRKRDRYANARELQDALELLLPSRRRLDPQDNPFPGMVAFQESDAERFFGRNRDISHFVTRFAESALLAVVAPSGVGKSSFVRAGVVPALRASGETWEVLVARPGHSPLATLASLLQPIVTSSRDIEQSMREHAELVDRLRAEPGYFGSLLRTRARQKNEHILLFVDQFEELYTLTQSLDERLAFTACLVGVADDPSTPLRVVLSMRSDFLHRAAEDRVFTDRLTKGIVFLPPIDRAGMREALEQPAAMAGFAFERADIVEDMLAALDATPGALPLLQFAASRMWDARDRERRVLTRESYDAMGGVAGALATHADQVINSMTPSRQRLARSVLLRLVTPDGTREMADADELATLGIRADVSAVIDQLVGARLLVVNMREERTTVELVHESLITRWPTLRRWREESSEDAAFLEQLRSAAKQWDSRGRDPGLLWRGDAMEDAQTFTRRYKGQLAAREQAFLDDVLAEATRSSRRKRRLVIGGFAFLGFLISAALIALVVIRDAQQVAKRQQAKAELEAQHARAAEAQSAKQLETISDQLRTIQLEQAAREAAEAKKREAEASLTVAQTNVQQSREQLLAANKELQAALTRATADRARAEQATKEAKAASQRLTDALNRERERNKRLEEKSRGVVQKL